MGLKHLRAFLKRHRRVAIDSCVFIYQFEAHPRYVELTDPIFRWVQGEGAEGCTSTLTLTELLVQPYRHCDQQRVDEFFALITAYPNLTWIPPDLSIAAVAARIRAAHRLRTPDAVQAATALHVGATGLISNDAAFAKWSSVEVLLLDHLL